MITLRCVRSDPAWRALLAEFPRAHDIEVTNVGLEEAFLNCLSAAIAKTGSRNRVEALRAAEDRGWL